MSAELLGERYQLTRELVRHPSYTVYEARDRLTEAPIGVTVVLAADGGWPASRRPFAQRLLRATHPHVVAAYDTGVYDDRPFVAFLRPARVLAAEMAFAPCSAAQVKRLGAEIASGLAALHQAGIRLGALHPGHIGVDADGAARLSPWPLASPPPGWGDATNWSPPEMLAGSPPTVSGDIWSLGAVMLATLIGPGPGGLSNGRVEALAGRLRQTVEPTLMQAIGQSMAAEPAQRFASASQVSSLLDSAFGGGQGATRVATQPAVRPREAIAHPSRLAGLRAVACTSAAAAMVASAVLASGKLTTLGTAIHTTSPPTAAATGTASNRQDSCAPARRTVTNGKTAACTPWPNRQDPVPMAVGPARTGAAAPVIAPRATNPLPPWRGSSVGFRPPVGSRAQTATLAVAATGLLSPILSDQPADTGITTNGQDDGADTSGASLGAPLVEPPTP